jgi:hypothetical protein
LLVAFIIITPVSNFTQIRPVGSLLLYAGIETDSQTDTPKVRRRFGIDIDILLTAIGFTPGGSSTVSIYTQTIH